MEELIVGSAKLGAVFGTFLGGGLMVCYGRRAAIVLDSFFFVLGPVTMAFSSSLMCAPGLQSAGALPLQQSRHPVIQQRITAPLMRLLAACSWPKQALDSRLCLAGA